MLRALISQLFSIIIALLIAIIIWSVATSDENPPAQYYPESLSVQTIDLPDGLVVSQESPTTVKVRLRAPQSSWDQLTTSSFRVLADLQGLSVGLHQVPVRLQVADPQVSVVSIEPSEIGVRLEQLKTRTLDIHSDILDTVPLGYDAKPPTVTPKQATVSGPAVLVEQVSEVVADVLLRGAKTPFGREVTLIARDAQGNQINGLTITPATVTVNVQIEQRVGYKDVSVKASLKGTVAAGYWVSNIAVNPTTVTIVGSADVLAKIPGYVETQPVDVTGATSDVTKKINLTLPDNVSVLNNDGVSVQVSITPILGGQTVPRKIIVQGLHRGATATVSPAQVDVILSGPLPALQSLSPDDVQVVIDASTLIGGTYQLRPRVPVVPDGLKVQSIVPDTVQVTVVEPTPTPSPTLTPTLGATPTLTTTIPISAARSTPTPGK